MLPEPTSGWFSRAQFLPLNLFLISCQIIVLFALIVARPYYSSWTWSWFKFSDFQNLVYVPTVSKFDTQNISRARLAGWETMWWGRCWWTSGPVRANSAQTSRSSWSSRPTSGSSSFTGELLVLYWWVARPLVARPLLVSCSSSSGE